jgi:hypothetical protein
VLVRGFQTDVTTDAQARADTLRVRTVRRNRDEREFFCSRLTESVTAGADLCIAERWCRSAAIAVESKEDV